MQPVGEKIIVRLSTQQQNINTLNEAWSFPAFSENELYVLDDLILDPALKEGTQIKGGEQFNGSTVRLRIAVANNQGKL